MEILGYQPFSGFPRKLPLQNCLLQWNNHNLHATQVNGSSILCFQRDLHFLKAPENMILPKRHGGGDGCPPCLIFKRQFCCHCTPAEMWLQ